MQIKIFIFILFLFLPFQSFAAVTVIDLFNSDTKTTGDLQGQDGWTGATTMDVQNTVVQEGDQAIEDANIGNNSVSLTVTGRTANIFSVYMRSSGTNSTSYLELYQGATFIGYVTMDTGPEIVITKTGCSLAALSPYSTDTWYKVEVEIDASTEGLRARVDGGTWTSWCTTGASFTEIDVLKLTRANNGTATVYFDNINYDDQAVSAAPNAPPTFLFFWISQVKKLFINTAHAALLNPVEKNLLRKVQTTKLTFQQRSLLIKILNKYHKSRRFTTLKEAINWLLAQ